MVPPLVPLLPEDSLLPLDVPLLPLEVPLPVPPVVPPPGVVLPDVPLPYVPLVPPGVVLDVPPEVLLPEVSPASRRLHPATARLIRPATNMILEVFDIEIIVLPFSICVKKCLLKTGLPRQTPDTIDGASD